MNQYQRVTSFMSGFFGLIPLFALSASLLAQETSADGADRPLEIIPSAQAFDEGQLAPSVEPTFSSPPLGLFQMGQLAESRTQLLDAREKYRRALQENPEDDALREHYAWFLYSNGYHDKECLRLLERTLQRGNASDPASLFNAIVEVRDELGLPPTPMKKPPGEPRKIARKNGTSASLGSLSTDTSRKSALKSSSKNVAKTEIEEIESFKRWLFVPSYSYSFFNKGRQGWQEEDAQLYYRVNRKLTIGGEIDILQRPPSGTNIYYSAMASYQLLKYLEVHGKISICPDPTFLATQIYSGGVIYQAMPRLGVLMDYQRLNFIQGPIDQVNPGIVYNFNDENWITLRYVRGWAFNELQYNYYSAALNLGLPGKRRLSFAFAYGTDPDAQVGAVNNNTVTSLSPAYTYSVFFTQPINRDLSMFAGVQYCYRLKELWGDQLYQQLTPTVGLALKF